MKMDKKYPCLCRTKQKRYLRADINLAYRKNFIFFNPPTFKDSFREIGEALWYSERLAMSF